MKTKENLKVEKILLLLFFNKNKDKQHEASFLFYKDYKSNINRLFPRARVKLGIGRSATITNVSAWKDGMVVEVYLRLICQVKDVDNIKEDLKKVGWKERDAFFIASEKLEKLCSHANSLEKDLIKVKQEINDVGCYLVSVRML